MNIIINSYITTIDTIKSLQEIDDDSINLIYIDPPYNTSRDFGDFNDKFDNMTQYRDEFMKPFIVEFHRILVKTGSIVVHVEPRISHHLRIILDEVFGEKRFVNEIVWKSGGNAKTTKKMQRSHDTILVYSKSTNYTFNPEYTPYDDKYMSSTSMKSDEDGRQYTTAAAHNSQPNVNPRPNLRYEWNGNVRQWHCSIEMMRDRHEKNQLKYNKNGIPRFKKYVDQLSGIPIRDLWCDISQIQKGEKRNYATQKPIKLLDRIIKMFSNEGDIVLDAFAGSGTTGRSAIKNNRSYLLFDINPDGREVFLNNGIHL